MRYQGKLVATANSEVKAARDQHYPGLLSRLVRADPRDAAAVQCLLEAVLAGPPAPEAQ